MGIIVEYLSYHNRLRYCQLNGNLLRVACYSHSQRESFQKRANRRSVNSAHLCHLGKCGKRTTKAVSSLAIFLETSMKLSLSFLCYSERTEEGNTEEGHGSRHGRPIKPAGGTGRCLLRAIGVNVLAPVTSIYLTSYRKSTGRGRRRAGGLRPCLLCPGALLASASAYLTGPSLVIQNYLERLSQLHESHQTASSRVP